MRERTDTVSRALPLLRCPYCTGQLKWEGSTAVRCSCDIYPVIRNILYLKKAKGGAHRRAVRLLSDGQHLRALLMLLDSRRIANYFVAFAHFVPHATLFSLLEYVYPSGRDWWRYLRNRAVRATHLLALSTIGAIRSSSVVADIGCGQGNFLSEAAPRMRDGTCIGIDASFFLLCVGRKYIVPSQALLICADVNKGLPLNTDSVDNAFLNDCFMYIRKRGMLTELHRVLTKTGQAFLTHVHASGKNNLGQGKGLLPSALRRMTRGAFLLGVLPDARLYSMIVRGTIRYSARGTGRQHQSFSYRLTRTPAGAFSPPGTVRNRLLRKDVDFTEDSHIHSMEDLP